MELKKLLYVINVDWFFVSHFLPLALEAKKRGYDVSIACGLTDKRDYLLSQGFHVYPLKISRGGTNIFKEISVLFQIIKVLAMAKPDIAEFFSIKPVLYGGLVSKFFSIKKKIFYITGLGYVFSEKNFKRSILRAFIRIIYRMALTGKKSTVIVENIHDRDIIIYLGTLNGTQIKVIKGAGVDLKKFRCTNENTKKITVVMASRLLRDKGVFEYIGAARILREKGDNSEFLLYGDIDSENPASLTSAELAKIKSEAIVTVRGYSTNVEKIFSEANIIILPSYREGFPKVLIEAAACGRAVVTTDVPGCRDAIISGETGILVPVKDPQKLADAIHYLVSNKDLRVSMGNAGRRLAENEYGFDSILSQHISLYYND